MSVSYEKRQKKWIARNGIKIGDRVRVLQKYKSETCGEWEEGIFWVYVMDDYVQRAGKIIGIKHNGIQLDFDDGVRAKYWFPYFVLRKEKKVKKSYTERQDEWIKKNDLKIGDRVRITRKAGNYEDGWGVSWASFPMDSFIGKEACVRDINGGAGIHAECEKDFGGWNFPYFVLEKVEPKDKEMKKSYVYRQAEWAKENDIKIGDKVRVIRRAKHGEDGWLNVWPDKADGWVGKILKVKEIRDGNISCYNLEETDWFNFPYFVLEKVMERKDKEWTVSYGLKVKTGDPVLMRDDVTRPWRYSVFSHKHSREDIPYPYYSSGILAAFCIPYVGNEHLVGTTDDYKAPEETTKPKFVFGAKVKATLSYGEEKEGVLIGIDTENPDTPFEVAVRDEDAELGRIRYWAESVAYID